MVDEIRVLGLLIKDRIKESGRTQKVLTKYAHLIKSRLGFHEVTADVCSRVGVIILQVSGDAASCQQFEEELHAIGGIEVQKMTFSL